MKNILSLLLVFPFALFSQNKVKLTIIQGQLNNITDAKQVYASYSKQDERVKDSAIVKNNKYVLKINLEEPGIVSLSIAFSPDKQGDGKNNYTQVYAGIGEQINVSSVGVFANANVTGAKYNDDFVKVMYDASKAFSSPELKELYKKYQEAVEKKDARNAKKYYDEAQDLQFKIGEETFAPYIKKNPSSPVALLMLNQIKGMRDIKVDKVEPLYNVLSPQITNYPLAKALKKSLDIAKRTGIGKPAINFMIPDSTGKQISLSSFRGKYVLIDFWASWCMPCRAENPFVLKAYNNFKDKGFDVLAVSLDEQSGRKKWLKAVNDDNMPWIQVFDGKAFKTKAALLYDIQSIPQNFLIDPKGIIIGKNLLGEELNDKLEEMFKTTNL